MSGCAPVASAERQTGVSDGKVEIARRYRPCSASSPSDGATPRSSVSSSIDGVRPSITIRISFLVAGKAAQAGVPVGLGAAEPRGEDRHSEHLEVAGAGDERETGETGGDGGDDQRQPSPRSATP